MWHANLIRWVLAVRLGSFHAMVVEGVVDGRREGDKRHRLILDP